MRSSIRQQSDELQTLSLALDRLTRQAKPLDALFSQATINEEDIQRLTSESKLIMGLHLADRGEFRRAIRECFEPVQLEQGPALTPVAAAASELPTFAARWMYWARCSLAVTGPARSRGPAEYRSQ